MASTLDLHTLQAQYAVTTAPLLRGILKVLTDMHCRNMTDGEKAIYMAQLENDMDDFKDALKQASKP
jgi:hypothetical protein